MYIIEMKTNIYSFIMCFHKKKFTNIILILKNKYYFLLKHTLYNKKIQSHGIIFFITTYFLR